MPLNAAQRHYEAWARDVRDPAECNCEGARVIRRGRAFVVYYIAPIPGGWAWRAIAQSRASYTSVPWRGPVATREQALNDALSFLRERMTLRAHAERSQYSAPDDARKVLDLLRDDLFGFIEPDPRELEEEE